MHHIIRPFEYIDQNLVKHLRERSEFEKPRLGLICSFANNVQLDRGQMYDFEKLESWIRRISIELNLKEPTIVGRKKTSHPWMSEVMEMIIGTTFVVADVTHPRENVIFELGIASTCRPSTELLIVSHRYGQLGASEIKQLQINWYWNFSDLKEIIESFLKEHVVAGQGDLPKFLKEVHTSLSPGAMYFLQAIVEGRMKSVKESRDSWHVSFPLSFDQVSAGALYAGETNKVGLTVFKYGVSPRDTPEWAVHPTELGKKYLQSVEFLSKFYPEAKIEEIRNGLVFR